MTLPTPLLSNIRGLIEKTGSRVKAPALLHFARVLTKVEQQEAEQTLEQGMAMVLDIPEPDGPPLLRQAVYLAAAVAPQRAVSLLPLLPEDHFRSAEGVIFNMLNHGHLAEAVEYLTHPVAGVQYPFHAAQQAFS